MRINFFPEHPTNAQREQILFYVWLTFGCMIFTPIAWAFSFLIVMHGLAVT